MLLPVPKGGNVSDVGRYSTVFTRLWLNPAFSAFTDSEKVLTLFLLTGSQRSRIGLYRLSPAAAAEELGTSVEPFRKRLGTVCAAFGWLFDADARVLYIPTWWRWNPPANANVIRGSLKDLNDIPPCGLMDAFARNTKWIPEQFHEAFLQGLREQLPSASRNQDQDLDPNQKQENRAPRGRGSERARADRGASMKDEALVSIARETLKMTNPDAPIEHLIDAFRQVRGREEPRLTNAEINRALTIALSERRVMA